jgi:hypothetical protein
MKSLGDHLYQFELPYSDYPEGFKELLKDEANWQKWVSVGPSDVEAYNYIDGTSVIGLISDVKFNDETFEFIYQDMSRDPEFMKVQKFYARGVKYKNVDEPPRIYQLFCFDGTPSEHQDEFRDLARKGGTVFHDSSVPKRDWTWRDPNLTN